MGARQRTGIRFAAVLAGIQALLAQTLLLREELLLYGGNEIAVGAFLGLWLIGIALGALGVRRFGQKAAGAAPAALLCQPLLLLVATWAARTARHASGIPAYEPFPLVGLLLWSLPVAVPVALATGASVPALAARARRAGGSVTEVYVAEAVGSFIGGAGTTVLLAAGVDPGILLAGCGALATLGCAPLWRGKLRMASAGLSGVILVGGFVLGPDLGDALRARLTDTVLPGAELLDYRETATGSLLLAALGDQQVLLADGRVLAAYPDPERVERAAGALAALTGAPKRLLVVGPEAVDVLPGLLALGALERVVWLVPDPGFRDFVLRHVPALAGDPRLRVVIGDPLRRRRELANLGPYDAAWVLTDTPSRRADERFQSVETLAAVAETLLPQGIIAVPVHSAENYVGPRLRLAVGTVIASLREVLGHVRLLPGEDSLVLGARQLDLLPLGGDRLAESYRSMAPRPERIGADGFASLLQPERVQTADRLVASLLADPDVVPSRIDRPLALLHNLLVRAEQERPELAEVIEGLWREGSALWVPGLVLALFALGAVAAGRTGLRRQRRGAAAVLASGGALGMALALTLIHLYQGRFGTLYLEVGWLFGLWMVGLALGGAGGRHACARFGPVPVGLAAAAGLAACGALIALSGESALPSRWFGAGTFVVAGALTGALIPVAETLLARTGVVGAGAGVIIEMADHLGGAVCALTVGILGISILGLRGTGWLVAGLALFATIALLLSRGSLKLPVGLLKRRPSFRSFPYPATQLVLFAVATAAVAGNLVFQTTAGGAKTHLDAEDLAATALPPPWREVPDPMIHYRAGSGDQGGVAAASRSAARTHGYGGPINVLVAAGPAGAVLHVGLLEHRETPSYLGSLDGFLDSLRGKDLLQAFRLRVRPASEGQPAGEVGGQPIDAMTGATVTSRAILEALEATGARLANPVFGRSYQPRTATGRPLNARMLYLGLALVTLLPVIRLGSRWGRRIWLLGHVVVGGWFLGVQYSSVQALSLLRLGADWNPLSWTGLLTGGVLLSSLLFGPLYCGYLCPAGALQELIGFLGGALGFTRTMPRSADRRARFLKYLLLAIVVTAGLGFASETAPRLDLLRAVWDPRRPAIATALLGLVALGSLFVVRFGCRYLCPTGAFLNLSNKFGPLRRFLPEKHYSHCDLGVRGDRDVDCLQCNRCRLGETLPKTSRPGAALREALIWSTAALLVVAALPSAPWSGSGDTLPVRVEAVDVSRYKVKISAGSLSDKPARYWHVVQP